MAIASVHQIAPIRINLTPTPTVLGSISSVDFRAGVETVREVLPGSIYPALSRVTRVRPTARITFLQIKQAIDAFGLVGYCPTESLDILFAKRDCGGIAAGSVHSQYRFADWLVIPRTLSARHQENASITYEFFAVSTDGTTNPLTKTSNVAIPATASDDDRWSLALGTFNGLDASGIRGFEIDFGLTLLQESVDSEIYDTFVGIGNVQPRITIDGIDTTWYDTNITAITGETSNNASTNLWLRKRDVADGVAEHIKFSTACRIMPDSLGDGAVDQSVSQSLVIESYFDGSNAPITVQTTQAFS